MIAYQNKKPSDRSIKYGYRFKTAINSTTTTTTNNTTTTSTTITILFFIIPIILLFFSLAESSHMTTMSFAQISSNNNNSYSTFPNSGPDTDRAPAFLDAYWTNYLALLQLHLMLIQ